jgi:hypothetical protein
MALEHQQTMTVEEYFQLEEYVLADSQSFKIEIYHKEQNKWIYDTFENTDEITLNSLGVHFSLADAYTDVEFEETTEEA